jgi:hypothetical protein
MSSTLKENTAILSIINKQKYHTKEKGMIMKQVKELMDISHPNVMRITNFFMSPHYYYFIE